MVGPHRVPLVLPAAIDRLGLGSRWRVWNAAWSASKSVAAECGHSLDGSCLWLVNTDTLKPKAKRLLGPRSPVPAKSWDR